MEYFFNEGTSDSSGSACPLHDAAECGDVELLGRLLGGGGHADGHEGTEERPLLSVRVDVNERDEDNLTPLHLAILNGHIQCVQALIEAGARQLAAEGSRPVHMAVQMGQLPGMAGFALECTRLLLDHGASPYDRDDFGRTPLHWAAHVGSADLAELLLERGAAERAAQRAAHADQERRRREFAQAHPDATVAGNAPAAAVADGPGDMDGASGIPPETGVAAEHDPRQEADVEVPPPLVATADRQGHTALHMAARAGQAEALRAMLRGVAGSDGRDPREVAEALERRSKQAGLSPLHRAAEAGSQPCCEAIMAVAPSLLSARCKKGRTAGELALRRGYGALAAVLGLTHTAPPTAAAGQDDVRGRPTLLVAPRACMEHRTFPEPYVRGASDVPPENVHRLKVLLHPSTGILHAQEFEGRLVWDIASGPAAMGDILRVHDWPYVRSLKQACQAIEDVPSAVSHLDGDTAISRRTFDAALMAAGAVTHAIDRVMRGDVKNAFCAIRPPGHHAGPSGVVTSQRDPNGSHGFCLLNNVAIGAAYALNVYRHAGIQRVAILDFDVHHGNGTEACVDAVVPRTVVHHYKTPFSEGVEKFSVWRPWLDEDDSDRVFFASVQGYGPKAPGVAAFVYPGSGATCDTRAGVKDDGGVDFMGQRVDEDPENEFAYHGGEAPRPDGPRVINVGIEHATPDPGLWRRAWRDKIFPALVKFHPDLILVSAGFDAHRKDEINFGYLGILEKEFEWISEQIVQVANRCCEGRVVSCLEGGYRIQGGVVSAFARSVAAHVHALCDTHAAKWDPAEARWEHDRERAKLPRPTSMASPTPGMARAHPSATSPASPTPHTPLDTHAPPGHLVGGSPHAELEPMVLDHPPHMVSGAGTSAAHVDLVTVRTPVMGASGAEVLGAASDGRASLSQGGGHVNGGLGTGAKAEGGASGAGAGVWEEEGGGDRKRRRRGAAVDYKALDAKLRAEEEEGRAGGK